MARHSFITLVFITLVWFVLCTHLSFTASMLRADTLSDARQEIEAVYAQRLAAYNKRDATAYLASFAPEYQSVNRAGRVTSFAQLRQNVTKAMSAPPSGHHNFGIKVQSVKLIRNQAVVVVKEHTEIQGRYAKTRLAYKSATDQILETIWSKRAGNWFELSAKSLSYRQVREG